MKRIVVALVAAAFGFGAAYLFVSKHLAAQHAEALVTRESAWEAERVELERAVENARSRPTVTTPLQRSATAAPATQVMVGKPTPAELIDQLRVFKSASGAPQSYALRRMLHHLEELVMAGPSALPAIRDFIGSGENAYFTPALPGIAKTFVPQTLRIGLLETAKRIGGAEAEALLASTLGNTSRSEEVVWLTSALQEIAPDKYRDLALTAARRLAETPASPDGKGNDRDLGFMLLTELRDTSYVSTAQQQIVRADGQVDRAALKYLQQTLGQQVVPFLAQLYDDARVTDSQAKEPFARVALNYVGTDQQANEFYVKAINDMNLSNGQRKNLIEDLNQDGFSNRKTLSDRDLPLINNRMALIEQLAPSTTDPVNLAAMKEAYKDLVKMRERALNPPSGAGVLPPSQVK